MKNQKNNTLYVLLFSVPGVLFFLSGIRLYFQNDTIGMLINCVAGISFLAIAYSRFKG